MTLDMKGQCIHNAGRDERTHSSSCQRQVKKLLVSPDQQLLATGRVTILPALMIITIVLSEMQCCHLFNLAKTASTTYEAKC